jgi:vitamin B12/bleomycin/antimicrobial peptide transport system ATP-binding/permease protein
MKRSLWPAFWRLAKPYWFSEDRLAGRTLFAVIVALNLAIIWVNVQLNTWNGDFYNALQDKRFDDFKHLLLVFTGWAFLYIILFVYQLYFTQMLQIRWRRWLTDVYLQKWMADSAHYRMSLADFGTDNPDQRIAEDFRSFVTDTLWLFFGLLSSVVSFISFVGILWGLSGAITLGGWTIPGYLVWVAIAYSVIGSVIAHWVGKPLVNLSFMQERYEADFRYSLVRARENAEGIALYRGESDELAGFRQRFGNVVANWWGIMKQQKRFTWFSSFYGQLAIIFPMLVAAPRYFSGAIQLGGLTQIANAFGEVQRALSWFVDAYVRFAAWRASIARLDGFVVAIEAVRTVGVDLKPQLADAIDFEQVTLAVPQAGGATRVLAQANGPRIEAGRDTLIAGPSGSGKSTLFRLLSGIWPYGKGNFTRTRPEQSLFLPQKPYLPLGTLRAALAYPRPQSEFSDPAARSALDAMSLSHLAPRLDEQANWSQILSGGEQQRLAAARALLLKPKWLYLDEATSALDDAAEAAVYQALRAGLPDTTFVSIAHRVSVARFHKQRLLVEPHEGAAATMRLEPIGTGH